MLADILLHSGLEVGDSLSVGLGLLRLRPGLVCGLDRLGARRLGGSLRLVCAVLSCQGVGACLDGLSLSGLSLALRLGGLG